MEILDRPLSDIVSEQKKTRKAAQPARQPARQKKKGGRGNQPQARGGRGAGRGAPRQGGREAQQEGGRRVRRFRDEVVERSRPRVRTVIRREVRGRDPRPRRVEVVYVNDYDDRRDRSAKVGPRRNARQSRFERADRNRLSRRRDAINSRRSRD